MAPPSFNILFVDDDDRLLAGLRRRLHTFRTRWSFGFVTSGEDALARLESDGADVIVSDMRMPGMSGVELLRVVQQRWPGTIRIMLSGQTDPAAILEGIGAVHQFLHKPCDPLELFQAIERSHELATLLDQPELRGVASSIGSLPVISETYSELLEALQDESADIPHIARIVERDVGLTAKLLQLVNSSFFSLSRRIDELTDAIGLVGVSQLRTIAMSAATFDALDTDDPCGAAIKGLWSASCEIARIAADLARAGGAPPDVVAESRLAGMLCLVGRAVLLRMMPDRFGDVRALAREAGCALHDAETDRLGAAQQLIGGYALGMWAFDADVVEAVTFQSSPDLVEREAAHHPVTYLHLARCCAPQTDLVECFEPSPIALERARLTAGELLERSIAA